eukprot:6172489-Alexandrium_andersonii.AAC.1
MLRWPAASSGASGPPLAPASLDNPVAARWAMRGQPQRLKSLLHSRHQWGGAMVDRPRLLQAKCACRPRPMSSGSA